MPASRSASAMRWVWALVRTSTACSDHGRPGARASRMARAMATASARSSAWPWTCGGAPAARDGLHVASGLPAGPEDGGGSREDLGRGPVAAGELDDLGRRPPALDVEEEAGVGPVPPVDRLLRVADRGHVVAVAPPRLEQAELQRVHVLELVHEEVPVPPALRRRERLVLLQRPGDQREQVVEVDEAAAALPVLVARVDLGDQVGPQGGLAPRLAPPRST